MRLLAIAILVLGLTWPAPGTHRRDTGPALAHTATLEVGHGEPRALRVDEADGPASVQRRRTATRTLRMASDPNVCALSPSSYEPSAREATAARAACITPGPYPPARPRSQNPRDPPLRRA